MIIHRYLGHMRSGQIKTGYEKSKSDSEVDKRKSDGGYGSAGQRVSPAFRSKLSILLVLLATITIAAACPASDDTTDDPVSGTSDQSGDTDDSTTDTTDQDTTDQDTTDTTESGQSSSENPVDSNTSESMDDQTDESGQSGNQQPASKNGATVVLLGDVPDITLTDVSSDMDVNLQSLVDGERPVLLWFWAPHCPICRSEAPDLEEFANENSSRVKVVGVGTFDSINLARSFVEDTGVTFTMLWSELSDSWSHYGVRTNSHIWLLDRNGNRIGDHSRAYDRALVESLLEELT